MDHKTSGLELGGAGREPTAKQGPLLGLPPPGHITQNLLSWDFSLLSASFQLLKSAPERRHREAKLIY